MNEDVLKKNVSEKITFYRKAAGLTQLELAEKLNYSDKSVSKWERGDGLPDITVLTNMAELFGVSVDDFVSSAPPKKPIKLTKKHTLIPALSVGLVWLVATFVFLCLPWPFRIFRENGLFLSTDVPSALPSPRFSAAFGGGRPAA